MDGAFGLWARAVPELRHLTEGIEGADSWVTDGHKWLQVPYDCGLAIVRDRTIHQRAMTQWSSYLPTIGEGDRCLRRSCPSLPPGPGACHCTRCSGPWGARAWPSWWRSIAGPGGSRSCCPGSRGWVLNTVVLNRVIVSFGEGDAASAARPPRSPASRRAASASPQAQVARRLGDALPSPRARRRHATTSRPRPSLPPGAPAAHAQDYGSASRSSTSPTWVRRPRGPALRCALIGGACREVGFFVITDHGVASAVIADTFAASAVLFAQPDEAKRTMAIGRLGNNRATLAPASRPSTRRAEPTKEP